MLQLLSSGPLVHKTRQCLANWMCWHVAMLIYKVSTDRLTWKLQVTRGIYAMGGAQHNLVNSTKVTW